ncbi:hypothetical protein [Donghicola eburneus]|uniref:Uncharacterized protein n=1 Tax=Donghicola eburneus TaxID=393278 RepID=A0A1M4N933_9RHOB|nr:hypothetical protein [Donghicola eburneus]SCM69696.1 hypothetical protein KARMA_3936 [Donghicola eburneus]
MGLKQIASRLITKHGQAAEILRPGEEVRDEYGGITYGEPTTHPVKILSAAYAIELQLVAGGLLGVGDQRIFVAADGLTIEPTTSDKLLIDGTEYRTIRVSPLAPAGEVIFWEMQVRDE